MHLGDQHSNRLQKEDEVFRTDRLLVRRWRKTDKPNLLAIYGLREVIRWVGDGVVLTAKDATQWMEVTRSNYDERGYGMFAIDDHSNLSTVGFGGLVHPNNQLEVEIKYAFAPKIWGRGLATEFVHGLLQYAKSKHRLTLIIATVAEENSASKKVLLKSGFQLRGTRAEKNGSLTNMFEVYL